MAPEFVLRMYDTAGAPMLLFYVRGLYSRVVGIPILVIGLAVGSMLFPVSPGHTEPASRSNQILQAFERRVSALRDAGRTAAAKRVALQAVGVARQRFGPQHWQVSRAINNLGAVFVVERRFVKAARLFKQALTINLRLFGPNHRVTSVVMNNLARAYLGLDHKTEALGLLQEVLRIQRASLGHRHPLVAMTLHNLATVQQSLGKFALAKQHFRASIEMARAVNGAKHISHALTLRRLAALHTERGELSEAIVTLNQAIAALDPRRQQQKSLIDLSRREIKKLKGLQQASI